MKKNYHFFKSVEIEADNYDEATAKFEDMLPEGHKSGWAMSLYSKVLIQLEDYFKYMTLDHIKNLHKEWADSEKAKVMEEAESYYD